MEVFLNFSFERYDHRRMPCFQLFYSLQHSQRKNHCLLYRTDPMILVQNSPVHTIPLFYHIVLRYATLFEIHIF